jgi:hypothetical protein
LAFKLKITNSQLLKAASQVNKSLIKAQNVQDKQTDHYIYITLILLMTQQLKN